MKNDDDNLRLHQSEFFSFLNDKRNEKLLAKFKAKIEKDHLNDRIEWLEKNLKLEQNERKKDLESFRTIFFDRMNEMQETIDNMKVAQVSSSSISNDGLRENLMVLEGKMTNIFHILLEYISVHSLVNSEKFGQ